MSAKILDGKELAKLMQEDIRDRVAAIRAKTGSVPRLCVILVGENPASVSYVKSKGKSSEKVGIEAKTYRFPEAAQPAEVMKLLGDLNRNNDVSGILVQLPLPDHFNKEEIIDAINPAKDVDGLHPVNVGKLVKNRAALIPCTPLGIMKLLDHHQIEVKSKHAVVIGRSDIVGKPLALLLMHRHATVSICHSRTADLPAMVRTADIVIAAVGKPAFVDRSFIKENATVIDVGVNRVSKEEAWEGLKAPGTRTALDFEKKGYTLVGDVDFDAVAGIAGAITPVPGGVGPMTIAMLLDNTVQAFRIQKGINMDEPG